MYEHLGDVITNASVRHADAKCTVWNSRAPACVLLLEVGASGRGGDQNLLREQTFTMA